MITIPMMDQMRKAFELSSSYLDKYILDNRYPKTNGYINLSYGGWGNSGWI